ncbi:MAG: hypothetical protein ACKOC5_10715 [Chloroflexota bacterium]
MVNALYVVGGRQRALRSLMDGNQNWNGYQEGVILRIDPANGAWDECVTYESPVDVVHPEDPAITFQAGDIREDVLVVCTQTEVMRYRLPGFEQIGYFTHPFFNDLHHVRHTPDGGLLLANAGLDMVVETTVEGDVLNAWNVLGEEPWQKIFSGVDYRKQSTKPHRSHPNYLFYIDRQPWATRFHQGDAINLERPDERIQISSERIHDGVVSDGRVYFTSVNGCLHIANTATRQIEQVINLNDMHPEETLLGWCRSLLVDGDQVWVGFSRIRPTKWRQNVTWLVRGFKHVQPTHIACYDLARRECLVEIDLEPMGMNAIYSIFRAG